MVDVFEGARRGGAGLVGFRLRLHLPHLPARSFRFPRSGKSFRSPRFQSPVKRKSETRSRAAAKQTGEALALDGVQRCATGLPPNRARAWASGKQQGCRQQVFPVRQTTKPTPSFPKNHQGISGGFDMTEAEFFDAVVKNHQIIQELLSWLGGLVSALIVATVWQRF